MERDKSFSQRNGFATIKSSIQINDIDDDLRRQIWNSFHDEFYFRIKDNERHNLCFLFCKDFHKVPSDEINQYNSNFCYTIKLAIKEVILNSPWFIVYDLIEFIVLLAPDKINFDKILNDVLCKELSAYRVVDKFVIQITNDEELNSIDEALNNIVDWKSVETHLKTSISLFANRLNPDFRNSIKEAISAVESLCIIITGDKDATLGKALAIIEKKHTIHGALKQSLNALYGYTSGASGIRHALLETDFEVGFEEAKFMLVSCSAFINFMKSKYLSN